MKWRNKKVGLSLLASVILLSSLLGYQHALSSVPASGPWKLHVPFSDASYYVAKFDNGTTYMVDANTWRCIWWSTNSSAVINACIGNLTNGGTIFVKAETYTIDTAIDFGNKSIILQGEGLGTDSVPTERPVTVLQVADGFADYIITVGVSDQVVHGVQIRNIMLDGLDKTTPLGGILWRNIWNGVIENVFINDFFGTSPSAIGINLYGDSGYGCYYNQIRNVYIRRVTQSIRFGDLANANHVVGGRFDNSRDITTYGLFFDGGDTNMIWGPDVANFEKANAIAVYLKSRGPQMFFGLRLEWNYKNIVIDAGGGTGNNQFIGGSMTNLQAGGTNVTDNGNQPSTFKYIDGFVTENSGTSSNSVNGTWVPHGLAGTPDVITLTISGSSYINNTCHLHNPSVIDLNTTHFQMEFHLHKGGNFLPVGVFDQRDIYWMAIYKP